MKYYVIAGEASGDLHASNLVKALRQRQPLAEFRGWGGDLMEQQGVHIVKHYRELAFMGFVEVLMNLRTILQNIEKAKQDIAAWQPDAIILVDYPGFNLRIAPFAKKAGIRVMYYISPQIWAWKESRVNTIKANVDHMFCILPFEKDFYTRHQYPVDYVGHPLLDAIDLNGESDAPVVTSKPIVALLPGSRKQEIATMLPLMLAAAKQFPQYDFVIAGAPGQTASYYNSVMGDSKVPVIFGKTYNLLQHARAALVTSGTATLETALFKVPQVVCYKGSAVSYLIAKQLVKVKYISLVNLVMDQDIVTELIQNRCTPEIIAAQLKQIADDGEARHAMLSAYNRLHEKLSEQGGASATTALLIDEYLKS